MDGVKNISSLLVAAKAKGARVVFVLATGDASKIALYDALDQPGFFGEGYAIVTSDMLGLSNDLIATGKQKVNGIVHMSAGEKECKATTCPHTRATVAKAFEMNPAYDAGKNHILKIHTPVRLYCVLYWCT